MKTNIICSECGKSISFSKEINGEMIDVMKECYINFHRMKILCKDCYEKINDAKLAIYNSRKVNNTKKQ